MGGDSEEEGTSDDEPDEFDKMHLKELRQQCAEARLGMRGGEVVLRQQLRRHVRGPSADGRQSRGTGAQADDDDDEDSSEDEDAGGDISDLIDDGPQPEVGLVRLSRSEIDQPLDREDLRIARGGSVPGECGDDIKLGRWLIGKRLRCLWDEENSDGKWYEGVADDYDEDTGEIHIKYDDGDVKWHDEAAAQAGEIEEQRRDNGDAWTSLLPARAYMQPHSRTRAKAVWHLAPSAAVAGCAPPPAHARAGVDVGLTGAIYTTSSPVGNRGGARCGPRHHHVPLNAEIREATRSRETEEVSRKEMAAVLSSLGSRLTARYDEDDDDDDDDDDRVPGYCRCMPSCQRRPVNCKCKEPLSDEAIAARNASRLRTMEAREAAEKAAKQLSLERQTERKFVLRYLTEKIERSGALVCASLPKLRFGRS